VGVTELVLGHKGFLVTLNSRPSPVTPFPDALNTLYDQLFLEALKNK